LINEGDTVIIQYEGEDVVMWEEITQCKDLGKVKNNVGDLVGLRGNLNSKWGSGGLLLVHNINDVQGFYAKKFETKKAMNKRNNKYDITEDQTWGVDDIGIQG
jgi:hypothetical protein